LHPRIGCERISGVAADGNYLNPIQSARIRTIDSVALKYGKVEVRAKLPTGDWLW
jgi:beta-glucanase (GH16 family)